MFTIVISFAALWTMCTPAKYFNDYYYQPQNSSRTTPNGIAAYRSALTLDWMAAEDSRQRELVAAFEQDPQFPSPITRSDCISYNRPSTGSVAKLMLEVLKNLEGDNGFLVAHLVQALVRAKLLMLETMMFENEPDFDALVKTPTAMIGEPHTTFPRIVEVMWMAVTDPSSVKKHGWCTVSKMTSFLQASRPIDIARHMRASEQIISRARFIMEEFIQHVTPLNMEKATRSIVTTPKFQPPTPLPKPRAQEEEREEVERGREQVGRGRAQAGREKKDENNRLVRMPPVDAIQAMQGMQAAHHGSNMLWPLRAPSTEATTEELDPLPLGASVSESSDIKEISADMQQLASADTAKFSSTAKGNHQVTKWLFILTLYLL